jgi:hypothetical protein
MTTNYSRSQVYHYNDLTEEQQQQVKSDYCFEDSDCYSTSYVILKGKNLNKSVNNRDSIDMAIPLSMFMRTGSKFTHGIFSTTVFDGFFITFDKRNEYATIAHKYF